jgi:hypothetical protein
MVVAFIGIIRTKISNIKYQHRVKGMLFVAHAFVVFYGITFCWSQKFRTLMNQDPEIDGSTYKYDHPFNGCIQWLIWLRLWHFILIGAFLICVLIYNIHGLLIGYADRRS